MDQNYINQWQSYFTQYRTYLVSFAFRMTGSLSEAEDLVQDTFMACADVDPATVQNHKSWLTKVCSNRALDHIKSAYKKREVYPGTWLPDLVPDGFKIWDSLIDSGAPDKNLQLSESLTTSFLLLIEKLTPEERVVYLLSEIFEYSFKEVSGFVDKSEDACRKIAQRARDAVLSDKTKFANSNGSKDLITEFFDAAKNGDQTAMMSMLAEGSKFWADGGRKVSAILYVLDDPNKITAFFKGLGRLGTFNPDQRKLEFTSVNSRPGLIISKKLEDGSWTFETIMSFEFADNKIVRIYSQRNPDKLETLIRMN